MKKLIGFGVILLALPVLAQEDVNGEKSGQGTKDLGGVRANRAFTVTGNLTGGPTYDRIFGGTVDNTCNSSVTFSGSGVGVPYHVVAFHSPAGGLWDGAEVVDAGTGITDSCMTLYCDPFDPANADLNVVAYDDDGGAGTLSSFTSADGIILAPDTTYYLVLTLFSPSSLGDGSFQLDLAGDVVEGEAQTVPTLGTYGMIGLLILLGLSAVMIARRQRLS